MPGWPLQLDRHAHLCECAHAYVGGVHVLSCYRPQPGSIGEARTGGAVGVGVGLGSQL